MLSDGECVSDTDLTATGSRKRIHSNNSPKTNEKEKTRGSSLFLKIEGRESNIAKLDPIKISRALYHEVGPVKEFKKSGNKVVVSCNDTEQALMLRALTELRSLNMLISVSENQTEPDFCQGIIRNVDLELTVEALADEFKNQNVYKVRRLGKTRTVLLYFKGTSLPSSVKIGYMSFKVSEYIPGPVRCYMCQEFGHISSSCKGTPRCVRCGDNHKVDVCPTKENPTCFRCQGSHSAAWSERPFSQEAKLVSSIQRVEKVSYSAALKKHRQSTVSSTPASRPVSAITPEASAHITQVVEESTCPKEEFVTLPADSFVTFIAATINATHDLASKSDRIKAVCEMAKTFLRLEVEPHNIHELIKQSRNVTSS